ncbi:MAG: prepilin-type N-terminal cleavage/methylation domain-containing protein [Verrucomicrobia bacterium]|nr:prepilin-type N-terminal cleavage/methylation domain-containing protein [Verrucomicrobiota bacterium]
MKTTQQGAHTEAPLAPPTPRSWMRRLRAQAGFTLIEVALSLVVVLIGVLALFALITSGLDSSAKGVADTHSALFADNVFNGLAAASLAAAEQGVLGGNVQWRVFWDDFTKGNKAVPIAAPTTWVPANLDIRRTSPGTPNLIKYQIAPTHSGVAGLVNHALKYSLTVNFSSPITPVKEMANTRVMVTLKVWDGEFSAALDADAIVYYSEFDNPGDL